MSRKSTDTSSLRFSSVGRRGIALEEILDGVGHELAELALELLQQLELWREACRFSSASASSVLRAPRSCCAWDRRTVMSLSAVPSSPTSSPEAGARAAKVSLADPPRDPRQLVDGPHHHEAHGDREHGGRGQDREDRRSRSGDCAASRPGRSTGSIDVATRTTARTLWSVPWHPWHRSWLAIGWLRTNRRHAVARLERLLRAERLDGALEQRARHGAGRARGASSRSRRPRPSAARPPSRPRARSRGR